MTPRGTALAAVSEALLRLLEGPAARAPVPSDRPDTTEDPATRTFAGAAAEPWTLRRKRAETAAEEADGVPARFSAEAEERPARTFPAAPETGERPVGAAAGSDIPETAARFAELPPAGGAAGRTMEEISEFFRRDSRRYDNGFTGGDDR